jgi:hypothetical protein
MNSMANQLLDVVEPSTSPRPHTLLSTLLTLRQAVDAERAECVMLNKGPFIPEAITILDDVLTRMEAHQLKKTLQLRALHSW